MSKSIELITRRRSSAEYQHMMEIWDCCTERFGDRNSFATWDAGFADSSDSWVAFKFWKEEYATYLKLIYPDLMTRDEFNFRDFNQFDE